MPNSVKISVEWMTRRSGNDGFVMEVHRNEQGEPIFGTEYGPMPCSSVLPFVEGRRRIVAMKALEHEASYVEEDFSYLTPGPEDTLQ